MQKPDYETLILRLESRIQYTFRDKKQIQLALILATKPTPQESFSWAGSYRPCLGGKPNFKGIRLSLLMVTSLKILALNIACTLPVFSTAVWQ